MPYNSESLYTPETFAQLEADLLAKYNEVFTTTLTIEQFRETNLYYAHELLLQAQLQNENNLGLLYSKIIAFLVAKQQFEIKPKGSTFTGLYNALKDLVDNSNQPLIGDLNIGEVNIYPSSFVKGQVGIVADYTQNSTNDGLIAQCLADNAPIAIEYLGTIEYFYTNTQGRQYTFKWSEWTTTNIKVKLHYKYDRNFYGNRLFENEIKNNFLNSIKANYQAGLDYLPAKINDITFYPSLAYVNTEISLDDGAFYLPLNAIILGQYNVRYAINSADDIELIIDP